MINLDIPDATTTSVDACHAALLYGMAVSLKPRRILELGVGTGYCTRILLDAIAYNGVGELTCVDSLLDQNGVKPEFLNNAHRFVEADEWEFLSTPLDSSADYFDLIVSDADHQRSHFWSTNTMRRLTRYGVAFFHDTSNPLYPNLATIEGSLKTAGHFCRSFSESTRTDEQCKRGWLLAFANKGPLE